MLIIFKHDVLTDIFYAYFFKRNVLTDIFYAYYF